MKTNLIGVLRDVQLSTLAFAIALGWSLFQLAEGVAAFIEGLAIHTHDGTEAFSYTASLYPQQGGGLTWTWGHHLFYFGQFVLGLIEVCVVLSVAALARRYTRRSD